MGERARYEPGTFCWTDLTTNDQAAAKAFYGGLFGWQAQDVPMDEENVYSLMRLDGKDVAAIAPQPPQQREAGAPPMWNSYVSVPSADAALARAQELGGNVHAGAFDVMQAGRMGVLQDPQGAYFMVWEPREHLGAQLVNVPGALVWNELATPDLDASTAFYSALFGWQIAPFESGGAKGMPYMSIKNGDASNGGMRALQPAGVPPHWLVYFGVEEIDSGLAKVGELGGSVLAGPIDIQMAKIAVVADPQGASFALYAGLLEP